MRARLTLGIALSAVVLGGAVGAQVPVGREFRANDQGAHPQADQVVAFSRTGEFLVAWEGLTEDGTRGGLWAQWFSPNGEALGHNLSIQVSKNQGFISALGQGPGKGVTIFWPITFGRQAWDSLFSRELSPNGSWLSPRHGLASLPQLAPRFIHPLPQGGFVVTLLGYTHKRDQVRTFLLFTDAAGNVVKGPGVIYPARRSSQYVDGMAVRPSGNFLVSWTDDGARARVLTQLFSPTGKPLHGPVQVHDDSPGVRYVGRVAALADKGYVVVWDDEDAVTGGVDLKMRFLNPDGSVRGPVLPVDPEPGYRLLGGDIAADAAGNFFVAWDAAGPRGLDSGVDVWGRMFRADGTPFGPSRVLNTFKPNTQERPIVAATASGTFVVVWLSFEQDGDGDGIFGQVFAVPPAGGG